VVVPEHPVLSELSVGDAPDVDVLGLEAPARWTGRPGQLVDLRGRESEAGDVASSVGTRSSISVPGRREWP
jgi:hypothetical protein